ncbi:MULTISPECIES: ribosome maturation factor RimM [Burkholderia]|jgi:16S rRNA processing protein RimM|uniref:Ribosome maturation factor RimM n=1 Tax=Burkholderia gladioli TaxID=28095 RepID=A0AB38TTH5_BURGA|nr:MULTISPECIES: ribosome maturation factor RimM [Burkholderia]KAF1064544.1 Ribosome maturation factor RimM [Burkholderia gladioli]KVM69453.1 16S rRNA processing protein RimM [Burkholderia gladioli]MBA1362042.1 ribosome maturation factor RimM [Burkholderia gladioli]MBJ9677612.1 ribosome maturation factor RimM [Burkholderia gladioli]MBU9187692.1 ribosome maturation factor RimM [Burkholderia gladioli]
MSGHDSSGDAKRGTREASTFGVFVRKPAERAPAKGGAKPEAAGGKPVPSSERLAAAQSWPDDAVEVGAIVDAYGLKGWVKIAPHAGAGRGGDALLKARTWWFEKGAERLAVGITQSKFHSDTVVAHLAGLADRDQALALRGYRVYVRREDFPALDADEFYWVDLIGLDVVNEAGVELGRVGDMIDNGVHSIMRVDYPASGKDGKPVRGERLIPFVGVYVKTVDQAAKRIVVDWEADY